MYVAGLNDCQLCRSNFKIKCWGEHHNLGKQTKGQRNQHIKKLQHSYSSLLMSTINHYSGIQFWNALMMATATANKSWIMAQLNTAEAWELNMFKKQNCSPLRPSD